MTDQIKILFIFRAIHCSLEIPVSHYGDTFANECFTFETVTGSGRLDENVFPSSLWIVVSTAEGTVIFKHKFIIVTNDA